MLVFLPIFGILTRGLGRLPFLVSALSIFLIANISMISRSAGPGPYEKGVKKNRSLDLGISWAEKRCKITAATAVAPNFSASIFAI